MQLANMPALVTGGASGLGAATVRALAAAGAKVAILDLNLERARELARETGGAAIACDATNQESASTAMHAAREAHGPARLLVNCAGIAIGQRIVGRDGPPPLQDFARVVQVNLIGSYNMMRLAASEMSRQPALEDGERGVIINTASVAAYEGQIGQAAYAASKGGIVSLTLPAAREMASFGIRVCAIAPGLFETPLLGGLPAAMRETLGNTIPFPKRLGQPADFARLALHIVENRYLNGEVIRLDGALRMPPK